MQETENNEPEPESEESPPDEDGETEDGESSAQSPDPLEESDPPIIIQGGGSGNP